MIVDRANSDFEKVYDFTVQDHNDLHNIESTWLEMEIEKIKNDPNRKIILLTHHGVSLSGTSAPKFINSDISTAFATDLNYIITNPVIACISGHSHYSYDFHVNNVRMISNQLGYPGENTGYSNKVIAFSEKAIQ